MIFHQIIKKVYIHFFAFSTHDSSSNDPCSQRDSRLTNAVTFSSNSNYQEDSIVNSPHNEPSTPEITINCQSISFSSQNQSFLNARLSSPIEKVTMPTQDEVSTDCDSDDGWSDDSVELIYVDDRYVTYKEKINSPSSSIQISEAHTSF